MIRNEFWTKVADVWSKKEIVEIPEFEDEIDVPESLGNNSDEEFVAFDDWNDEDTLIEVEHKVRNVAAHEIVSVTADWIQKRIGKKPEDIMAIIQFLCVKAGVGSRKEDWNSYDDMNQKIIQELEKQCL